MPGKMRARHDVFGVKDVLDNEFHRSNGWTKVADDTPLTVDEQRRAINEARTRKPSRQLATKDAAAESAAKARKSE